MCLDAIPEHNITDLTLDLNTSLGDINVPDELDGKLISTDDNSTYENDSSSAENHLSIQSDEGDITVSLVK